MPLISRSRVPLPLKDMPQMPTTVRTRDLNPLHPKRAIRVSRHSTRDGIKVRRPSAPGLELMRGLVERGIAASAIVDAACRVV